MRKTLVIMRHAKAKRPAEGEPDIERQLSEAGKRSMKAMLPHMLGLWSAECGAAQIWSSPAVRTQQTSELLLRALKAERIPVEQDVRLLDCLWSGEVRGLIDALCASEAETVVLVGHNPFVEDLVCDLTGSQIVFATGAMASIAIETDDLETLLSPASEAQSETSPKQRLLWFSQGPISQKWKTLVDMEKTIYSAVDAVTSRRDSFLEDPDDIETMHKFRVSIRTLRSLIAFVKPWQDSSQNARAQEDLKAIVAVTSRLRELDVLTEQAAENQGASQDLVDFCATRAAEERASVIKALESKQLTKRLDRVTRDLKSFKWKKRYVANGLDTQSVRAHFDEMADSLREDLDDLDFAEVEKTHDVRKRAKRVRYNAEKFKGILGVDAVGIAKDMTSHQDNLGAICDARVNIDIINGFSAEDLPDPVAWDLALLRAENETFLYTTLRESH